MKYIILLPIFFQLQMFSYAQMEIEESTTYKLVQNVVQEVHISDTLYFRMLTNDPYKFDSHSNYLIIDSVTVCIASIHYLFDSDIVASWYEFEKLNKRSRNIYQFYKVIHPRISPKRVKIRKVRL